MGGSSRRSTQLPFPLGGFFVMKGRCSTLPRHAFLLLIGLGAVLLGLLSVLLGLLPMLSGLLGVPLREGAVPGRLAPMLIDRPPQVLSLRRMSVCLLTVTRCLGSQALSQKPLPLGPAPDKRHGDCECDQRNYDYGDDQNRRHVLTSTHSATTQP
jgi:hypothetical protein